MRGDEEERQRLLLQRRQRRLKERVMGPSWQGSQVGRDGRALLSNRCWKVLMILRLYSLDKISYISYIRSVLLTPAYTHKAFWTRGVIPSIFTMPPTFQEPPAHAELAAQVTDENSPGLLLRDHDPGWQLNPWGHDAKKFQCWNFSKILCQFGGVLSKDAGGLRYDSTFCM